MSNKETSFSFTWIMFLIGFVLGIVVAVWVMNYLKPITFKQPTHAVPVVASSSPAVSSAPTEAPTPTETTTSPQTPVAQQLPAPDASTTAAATPATDDGQSKPTVTAKTTTETAVSSDTATNAVVNKPITNLPTIHKSATAQDAIGELARAGHFKTTYVQVAAVSTLKGIQAMKAQLQLAGFQEKDVHVKTVHHKTTLYRVYLGPFKKETVLRQVITRLQHEKIAYSLFY